MRAFLPPSSVGSARFAMRTMRAFRAKPSHTFTRHELVQARALHPAVGQGKRRLTVDLRTVQMTQQLGAMSAADTLEAQHKRGALQGIDPLWRPMKLCGPSFTIRTIPGDNLAVHHALNEVMRTACAAHDINTHNSAMTCTLPATRVCAMNAV